MIKFLRSLFGECHILEEETLNIKTVGNIKIKEIETEKEQKTIIPFSPSNFKEYVGQRKVKQIISKYIEGVKKRNLPFPHTIIYGKPGMGKTTLARIIAKMLNKDIVEIISSSLSKEENILQDKIKELKGRILFIDEIHALPRNEVETIYSMMEDFTLNGNSVSQFTLIGATTEIGEIIKNRKPFYDRFGLPLELKDYTINNLITIGKQYKEEVFPEDELEIEKYKTIAENSRTTPRIVIRLIKSSIYFGGNIEQVLKSFGIIYKGYTEKDYILLNYLSQNRVVGLQGIASFLDTSLENYLYEIEPYLIKTGLIIRTPRGREISSYGKKILTKMKGIM